MLCILIRCTYDKNIEIIQPFIQELQHFLCFQFWPPGGQVLFSDAELIRYTCVREYISCTKREP
jgi:hypothetical protein